MTDIVSTARPGRALHGDRIGIDNRAYRYQGAAVSIPVRPGALRCEQLKAAGGSLTLPRMLLAALIRHDFSPPFWGQSRRKSVCFSMCRGSAFRRQSAEIVL
jgi:hypothetical protein